MNTILIETVARFLLLPSFIIAGAVLVKGYAAVGDGFSAGVIAATGIFLQYLASGYRETERLLPIVRLAPWMAAVGLLIGLLVAFVPVFRGNALLTHVPPAGAEVIHLGTLEVHSAFLFDLGVFLLVFGFTVSTIRLLEQEIGREER